ncbi:transcription/translation regulatory transformer protein RfaH [Marinimicrobium sp. ABcell2]|uniref:transcription/translation regulatory transformer protein RfaH n=1 Tax=Marinimicrobium sp. ABcell2 TaxID=3069751 RepID=UPI0027B82B55|nr:transcription/translation regulatory transformer protein RfaH [Marinimicrobium sp. ABcell2]MDQ2078312.1 transcription/translation regulatory transformer protein RfaH [Marinimicrobium sp. ABcell2]
MNDATPQDPQAQGAQAEGGTWYLVQCKAREAFRAQEHLANQGFECFLPTHPVKRTQRQKTRWVTEPLFPHYLFIRLTDASNWGVIRSTRGVAKVVSFNGQPRPVADSLVAALQHHCALLNGEEPAPLFKTGEKVVITEGCFRELEAVVQATKGEERVVLLLTLLNRQQQIEVPISTIASR